MKKTIILNIFLFLFISIVFYGFYLSTISYKSATYDEPTIIAAGNHFLKTFDNSINAENPPFLKALLSFPTLLMNIKAPEISEDSAYSYSPLSGFEYGRDFMFNNNFTEILFWCRAINIFFTLIFSFIIYLTLKILLPAKKKLCLLGSILFLFLPNVIANGRLATLDMGNALLLFSLNYTFLKYYFSKNKKWLYFTSILLALSLLSKFTAVTIIPILIIQTFILFSEKKITSIKSILFPLFIFFLISSLIICLFYINSNFSFCLLTRNFKSTLANLIFNNTLSKNIPVLLPENYLKGFDIVANINYAGDSFTFLGRKYLSGVWFYYFVLIVLKIPLPILFFAIFGLILIIKKYFKSRIFYYFLVPPLITLICFSFISQRQLGFRYILPIIPYIALSAIYCIKQLWNKKLLYKFIVIVLLLFFALEDFLTYPNYLTYFNQLIGGSKNAYKYFDDSNLDWGQDLPSIKKWTINNGSPRIELNYFGVTPVELYNLKSDFKDPEYFLCSVYNYHREKQKNNLLNRPPDEIICNTILVYKVKKNYNEKDNSEFKTMKTTDLKLLKKTEKAEINFKSENNLSCDEKYYIEVK